ncbi:hypothetical protein J1N35_034516 [Gossypium stocksii]|uniref:Uncharacterized protein n=1 Tax=Gossypium stocksii TaxID=47602 RepID=A0A9D3ZPB0_9ROSI|nr:hypothetical protein J1N35_034516 [Gossypium stocksii]
MANVTTGFEHVTTMPKFKRRKVSTIRDFLPRCGGGVAVDFGLNRQIAIDQGKYSLIFGSGDYEYLVLQMMEKGNSSGKEMANVTTGFEHVTTMPKFKPRKVSAIRGFLPKCGRGATVDFELNRQIAVDQGKYSLIFGK